MAHPWRTSSLACPPHLPTHNFLLVRTRHDAPGVGQAARARPCRRDAAVHPDATLISLHLVNAYGAPVACIRTGGALSCPQMALNVTHRSQRSCGTVTAYRRAWRRASVSICASPHRCSMSAPWCTMACRACRARASRSEAKCPARPRKSTRRPARTIRSSPARRSRRGSRHGRREGVRDRGLTRGETPCELGARQGWFGASKSYRRVRERKNRYLASPRYGCGVVGTLVAAAAGTMGRKT